MKPEDHFRLALRNHLLELAEARGEDCLASLLGNKIFQMHLNILDPERPAPKEAEDLLSSSYKHLAKILYYMTVFTSSLDLIEKEVTAKDNGSDS